MRIAGREKLVHFMHKHAAAKKTIGSWLAMVEREVWSCPQDIKNLYRSADILSGNRVVFNIGGNNFRLVVVVRYTASVVLIDRIGTHSEYSKWKLD
jgi:mRNA interferase HigB